MRADKTFATLVIAAALAATARTQEAPIPTVPTGPFANRIEIDVKLDDATKTLIGSERVTFTNLDATPVAAVPFHLYPNAWSNTDTAWIKDGRAQKEVLQRREHDGGYLRIVTVKDAQGVDLGAATTIEETVMRVALANQLAQNESFTFVIEFETKLPKTVARMGKCGDHLDVMQWFPKPCAHLGGRFVDWPFRNPSEFFADFGSYKVTITTPTRYVVDATGIPGAERVDDANGTRTVTYEASAVHDFAWCADPNFIVHRETAPGGPEIILLNQPFLEPKAGLTLDAVKFALHWTGEHFFPYPYPRLVIDAVPLAGQGGGMEYPMLFTISAGAPEALPWLRNRSEAPASVTIHEYLHQYFYGMVASNEFEEAWLDEGFTTYVQNRILDDFWRDADDRKSKRAFQLLDTTLVIEPLVDGGSLLGRVAGWSEGPFRLRAPKLFGFDHPTLRLVGRQGDRFRNRMNTYADFALDTKLETHSWDVLRIGEENAYRATAYSKPALFLRTLEGVLGRATFDAILREWARTQAFKHPTAADFVALVNARTQDKLKEFVERGVFHEDVVDWAVEDVRCVEVKPRAGFAPQSKPGDAMKAEFPPHEDGPGIVERWTERLRFSTRETPSPEGARFTGEVVVRNRGTLPAPVLVELRYADGTSERRALTGSEPWVRIVTDPKPSKLIAAIVDPDRTVALDLDWINNGRLVVADEDAGRALAAWVRYWAQSLMSAVTWAS